jgi:hypothetical protein
MENGVKISWDVFRDLLETRRKNVEEWWSWTIENCVWDWAMELLEETGGLPDPELNAPSYIVDNIAVNSDVCTFEEFRLYEKDVRDFSDDELIEYLEERGEYEALFPEEKIILWRLGL